MVDFTNAQFSKFLSKSHMHTPDLVESNIMIAHMFQIV